MQIFSKKTITLSILLLNYSLSFGMISDNSQKLCNDNFLIIATHTDGKTKNILQKTNTFFNKTFSKKNSSFLLNVDLSCIAAQDKENILLTAMQEKNKPVIERFEKIINEIQIRTYNTVQSNMNFYSWQIHLQPTINLEEIKTLINNQEKVALQIKDIDSLAINPHSNQCKLVQDGTRLLQKIALYGDSTMVKELSLSIKGIIGRIDSALSRYISTLILLEEVMQQGHIERFKAVAEEDPFDVCNLICVTDNFNKKIFPSILEALKNINMPENQQNQKKLCIEIYRKTIKEDILRYIENK